MERPHGPTADAYPDTDAYSNTHGYSNTFAFPIAPGVAFRNCVGFPFRAALTWAFDRMNRIYRMQKMAGRRLLIHPVHPVHPVKTLSWSFG